MRMLRSTERVRVCEINLFAIKSIRLFTEVISNESFNTQNFVLCVCVCVCVCVCGSPPPLKTKHLQPLTHFELPILFQSEQTCILT